MRLPCKWGNDYKGRRVKQDWFRRLVNAATPAPVLWSVSILLFAVGAGPVFAQPVLSLSSGANPSCSDDEIGIILSVENGANLSNFGVEVTYDPDLLDYSGFGIGGSLVAANWSLANATSSQPGSLIAGGVAGSGAFLNGGGELMVLRFRCKAAACPGVASLTLQNPSGATAAASLVNGEINCGQFPVLAVPDTTAECAGGEFSVPVVLDNVSAPISTFGVEMIYDPGELLYVGADPGFALSSWGLVGGNEPEPGRIILGGASLFGDTVSSGVLMSVRFIPVTCPVVSGITLQNSSAQATGFLLSGGSVTLIDSPPPVPVCQDISVALSSGSVSAASFDGGSSDPDGDQLSFTFDTDAGLAERLLTCDDIGSQSVTIAVNDGSKYDTCVATLSVIDDIDPEISAAPEPVTVVLGNDGTATVNAASLVSAATDNCGTPVVTADPAVVDCDDLGVIGITLTATDATGNTVTATAQALIIDVDSPVAVTQDIEVAIDTLGTAVITAAQVDGGSTDNCGIATLSVSKTLFDCGDIGGNTVTLTVTDESGNSTTALATVTVTGTSEQCDEASRAITGVVRDGRTGSPLSGATVTMLRNGTSQALDSFVTGEDGRYKATAPETFTSADITFFKQGFSLKRVSRISLPSIVSVSLDSVAPPPPIGLEAFSTVDSVTLAWQPSAAVDLAGYHVYRSQSSQPDGFARINTAVVADTRYEDTAGVNANSTYSYYVTAVDFDGNESIPSQTAEATPGTVVLWLPNLNAKPGEMLRVPLNVRNAAGLQISGMQIDFRYPASWLGPDAESRQAATALIRVEKTVLTQRSNIQANTATPGRVLVSGLSSGGGAQKLVGEGGLFNVFLPIAPGVSTGAECGELKYQSAVFATDSVPPQALPVDVSRTGLGCIETTCYTGDVNGDGAVNILDVIYTLQISSQLAANDACSFTAGELNGDDGVNSGDAILIWRTSLELDVNPPQDEKSEVPSVEEYWRNKGGTLSVTAGSIALGGASSVQVPVSVTGAAGVGGLDLLITYPESTGLVTLASVELAGIAQSFELKQKLEPGAARISMSRATPFTDEAGDILLLTFNVSPEAPAGAQLPIVLSAAELRGEYGENLKWFGEVGRADGAILVGGVPEITGHQGDWDANNVFSLSEVLRLVQFYNVGAYGCDAGTEDGFAPGSLDRICSPHTADYQSGADWSVSLNELLRVIQLFNAGGFSLCEQGEDGFCLEE